MGSQTSCCNAHIISAIESADVTQSSPHSNPIPDSQTSCACSKEQTRGPVFEHVDWQSSSTVGGIDDDIESSRTGSQTSTDEGATHSCTQGTLERTSTKSVLDRVETLIDTEHDILAADALLNDLHGILKDDPEWAAVLETTVFKRFAAQMEYFEHAGQVCCGDDTDWFNVYADKKCGHTIQCRFDADDKNILHYRVRAQVPASLTNVLAVANEVQLIKTWNSLVVDEPEVLGPRTAHHMVFNYRMSLLSGLQKVDLLNEIRRFSDQEGGILVEHIESLGEDHPCYRSPAVGFKRPECHLRNVWVACGPQDSMLVQVGKLRIPFTPTKFLLSALGSVTGSFILGGLVKNSLKASEPGNPWESLLAQDTLGLYRLLDQCVGSEESAKRIPSSTAQVSESSLRPLFQRRRTQRFAAHS